MKSSNGKPDRLSQEILYLDDRPENVAAGAARGWQVVLQETPRKDRERHCEHASWPDWIRNYPFDSERPLYRAQPCRPGNQGQPMEKSRSVMSFKARRVVWKRSARVFSTASSDSVAPGDVLPRSDNASAPAARNTSNLENHDSARNRMRSGKTPERKKRMIANVHPQRKLVRSSAVWSAETISKKVIQRIDLTGKDTFGCGCDSEKVGQNFGDIISHRRSLMSDRLENISHQHVEVKTRGNPQTTSAFQQGMEQGFIVQYQVTRLLIREQFYKQSAVPILCPNTSKMNSTSCAVN